MEELSPTAIALEVANRNLRHKRRVVIVAKAQRDECHKANYAALIAAIQENPEETNVSLAARFGLRSEASIRNLRKKIMKTIEGGSSK